MFRSAACAAALLTLAMPALAGMDDFIAKPFDPERVLRVIRASVERGDAGRVA